MKIVVIGGTGLIGSKTTAILRQGGHEVVAASRKSGIDAVTGEGLKEAMAGATVVVDLANSPSFEDKAVMEFFETSGRNLLAAEDAAGVRHHVALSIVGTDRTPENGYFRAKVAQESLASMAEIAHWRDALAERLKAEGAVVLGESAERLPQTLCFAGAGFGSEVQVMNMDLAGVMVSAGSACSSGKVRASRVVEAMGRSDLAPFALLLDVIRETDDSVRRLMLVGHNPGCALLATMLAGSGDSVLRARLAEQYPTGALAEIGFEVAHWREIEPQAGALARFIRPRDLDGAADGEED